MSSWSDVPVLSGVSYSWITVRHPTTKFYGGKIFVPARVDVPCPTCMVPHGNASTVFCFDPWANNHVGNGKVVARGGFRFPIICFDCHDYLLVDGIMAPG